MSSVTLAKSLDRQSLMRLADWLAVAVAVSLPWSTSATSILVALWLVAVLATLDLKAVRREVATAAGGLPILLWALGAAGMLWADVSWGERFAGFSSFNRLLALPLVLAQFRRSDNGVWVLRGFFLSVVGVLLLSWTIVLMPGPPPISTKSFGVPVKDYILQSTNFLICAFALFECASQELGAGRWRTSVGLIALSLAFVANILFVAVGRTTLVVAPVLVLLFGWRRFGWRGLVSAGLVGGIVAAAAWFESPYLRQRLDTSMAEFEAYRASDQLSSTGLHAAFLRESLRIVAKAPLLGHGTGSIAGQFRGVVTGESGSSSMTTVNPHNQIFAVAIQLGLVGAAVLIAMWVAHLMLFRGSSFTAWLGLLVVVQNVVSSLFNSHLFDFTQAWIYIFGVGVAGGMMLRERDRAASLASRP